MSDFNNNYDNYNPIANNPNSYNNYNKKRSRSPVNAYNDHRKFKRSNDSRRSKQDDNQYITLKILIKTQVASAIIGKGGKNIDKIRSHTSCKMNISDSIPGNPERILFVSGPLDAVSKTYGLIVRHLNDEDFNKPSLPGSKAITLKFIIPNSKMGFIIGKQGMKIKQIQEASGAKLSASESLLPNSTERLLSIDGVADAIHIAIYYVGDILIERQDKPVESTRRRGSNSNYYPNSYDNSSMASYQPSMYGNYIGGYPTAPTSAAPAPAPAPAFTGVAPIPPTTFNEPTSQKIYIPNALVGGVIGKGGSKINEIRNISQCQVKILEPGEGEQSVEETIERLVVITGSTQGIQIAINMLSQRIESEKSRNLGSSQTATS